MCIADTLRLIALLRFRAHHRLTSTSTRMGCCSNRSVTLYFCVLGFGLAAYSLYEELQMEANPEYRPLCDIQEGVSCSKAFKSEWGTGFGFIHKIVGEATGTRFVIGKARLLAWVEVGFKGTCLSFGLCQRGV